MMKQTVFIFLILFFSFAAFPQSANEREAQERRNKIELILRFQDTRTIHDGKLISFLSDPDPLVRERAVRAYGSIQDTSILNLLVENLSDRNPDVQFAAAFAIGQTASQLSRKSREILQHDLIWRRLDQMSTIEKGKIGFATSPVGRMIEELGKFGTNEALDDLMLRFGNVYPRVHSTSLIMSIARFAIRNITSETAVRYLLTFTKPADVTPWQVAYALQRIGSNKEIRYELENIVQLYKHRDPLVRMNLATLLGKIHDEQTSLEPLQKMADFDGDWRVRVNALKALGNFKLQNHDEIIETFRRSFYSGNDYIALTALTTFGNTGVRDTNSNTKIRETFGALKRIAQNKDRGYRWQIQGEAAIALGKLSGKEVLPVLQTIISDSRYLQAKLIEALGQTGASEVFAFIVGYIGSDIPLLYAASLDGLSALCHKNSGDTAIVNKMYDICLEALGERDIAVLTTTASILGDSLFLRSTSVNPLIEALSVLHIPDDIEAMQEIISTLGKLKDDRAVDALLRQVQQPDRSVSFASASALQSITGRDYSSALPKFFEPLLTDFDFEYLLSLRDAIHMTGDTVRVKLETIRGDVLIDLYKNVAPFTVMNFLKLATQRGFYSGLPFHRVVPNFVIQGGDPRGDGWGGPGYTIRSEFSPLTFETGAVGMASAGKDTEGSQFFITQSPQPHLDGRYTLFGKVVSGMDVVNKIRLDDHLFDVKVVR
jgi:cyclophilin family peptidyl-prolyl cis-trans isomerase/HEAT repeat protein